MWKAAPDTSLVNCYFIEKEKKEKQYLKLINTKTRYMVVFYTLNGGHGSNLSILAKSLKNSRLDISEVSMLI